MDIPGVLALLSTDEPMVDHESGQCAPERDNRGTSDWFEWYRLALNMASEKGKL